MIFVIYQLEYRLYYIVEDLTLVPEGLVGRRLVILTYTPNNLDIAAIVYQKLALKNKN